MAEFDEDDEDLSRGGDNSDGEFRYPDDLLDEYPSDYDFPVNAPPESVRKRPKANFRQRLPFLLVALLSLAGCGLLFGALFYWQQLDADQAIALTVSAARTQTAQAPASAVASTNPLAPTGKTELCDASVPLQHNQPVCVRIELYNPDSTALGLGILAVQIQTSAGALSRVGVLQNLVVLPQSSQIQNVNSPLQVPLTLSSAGQYQLQLVGCRADSTTCLNSQDGWETFSDAFTITLQ